MLKALSQVDQPAESEAPFDRILKGMTRQVPLVDTPLACYNKMIWQNRMADRSAGCMEV